MQQRITKNLIIKQMQNLKSCYDPKAYNFIDKMQNKIIATKDRKKRNLLFQQFLEVMKYNKN